MSSYASIRDGIVAVLNTVPNIGRVHPYIRFAARADEMLSLFKATINGVDQIRAWTVSLESTDLEYRTPTKRLGTFNYVIHGYLGLDDGAATEETFLDLCEAVVLTLQKQDGFGAATELVRGIEDVNIRAANHIEFGSTLCHHCEVAVRVNVELDITWS